MSYHIISVYAEVSCDLLNRLIWVFVAWDLLGLAIGQFLTFMVRLLFVITFEI